MNVLIEEEKCVREVIVQELYWINSRGCHYSLTPISENDRQAIKQFWIDTTSLRQARREAKKWIIEQEKQNIAIEIKSDFKRRRKIS